VIAIAAALIVAASSFASRGFLGEMAGFPRDMPEFAFAPRSSMDLMSLELPVGFFGFQERPTASALNAVGRLLAEREAEVEYLRALLARRDDFAALAQGARPPNGPAVPSGPEADRIPSGPEADWVPGAAGAADWGPGVGAAADWGTGAGAAAAGDDPAASRPLPPSPQLPPPS